MDGSLLLFCFLANADQAQVWSSFEIHHRIELQLSPFDNVIISTFLPYELTMRPPQRSPSDDFELESLVTDDEADIISSPDAPLAMSPPPSNQQQPKWLSPLHQRPWYLRWLSYLSGTTLRLLRPRLTWRYVLFATFVVYFLYCTVISSPLLASPLPPYTGSYGVGAFDLEVPLPKGPQRVSDAVFKSGDPAFDVESVLVTFYYPTEPGFHSKKKRYTWIPKPVSLTAEGYAKLAGVNNFIMRPIFTLFLWAVGGGITIPAEVDAPLLDADKEEALPVMVFSHGMASSRTDYTNFLGELASRGHVVAAIEHRDGSSPGSLIKLTSSEAGRKRLHFKQSELKEDMDTPEFKKAQLAYRDAEIGATIDLLKSINDGNAVNNTRAPVGTLEDWSSRLNFSQLTIGGHSYGATGALQALSTVAPDAVGGVILDPGKSSGPLNHDAEVPLLIIHSNSWSKKESIFHGRPHFDTVRDLVKDTPAPSWFLTSLGTAHPSVTDAPLLEPLMLSWTTGANMDVKEALKEYVNVSDEFFTFIEVGKTEKDGLLSEEVTHEKYGEWVSEERKKEFSKTRTKHWEIHVSPEE